MLKIGITGGIGSGKSTLCQVFEKLGTPVYYADPRAKRLMIKHQGIRQGLIALFGDKIYMPDGQLNRQKLAQIIFNDAEALKKVNQIVHPRVQEDFINWTKNFNHQPYVIKEAAILFESRSHEKLDASILVHAPENLRIKRVIKRDRVDEQAVRARMKNQWTDEEKLKLADFVIYNDGLQLLMPQVLDLHQKFSQGQTR